MKVVSNTSPILNLALVGELSLLQRLFGEVAVPDAVRNELETLSSAPGTNALHPLPAWVTTRSIANRPLVDSLSLELDAGEAEAIALAVELNADIILLDERLARRVAAGLSLKVVGVVGLLIEAKRRSLIPFVKPVLDVLMTRAGFWIGPSLYARALADAGE